MEMSRVGMEVIQWNQNYHVLFFNIAMHSTY